jgi:PAS domain S-box-containing protein
MSEKAFDDVEVLEKTIQPTPIDKEVQWNKGESILCKMDPEGLIEYANDAFIDVCGYEDYELISQSHSITRHPDMPEAIFNMVWDNLRAGKKFQAIVKNLAKSGRYYWVSVDYDVVKNENDEIMHFFGREKAVPADVITKHIEPLHKRLLNIERASGVVASEKYLVGFLEESGKSYMEYLKHVNVEVAPKIDDVVTEVKKGAHKSHFLNVFTF